MSIVLESDCIDRLEMIRPPYAEADVIWLISEVHLLRDELARKKRHKTDSQRRHRTEGTEYQRSYRQQHPERYLAWGAVKRALKSGRLVRPTVCEKCGRDGLRIEASHDDYSKPLDVKWLCVPCHRGKDGWTSPTTR